MDILICVLLGTFVGLAGSLTGLALHVGLVSL